MKLSLLGYSMKFDRLKNRKKATLFRAQIMIYYLDYVKSHSIINQKLQL
jgi:hypothetical protein